MGWLKELLESIDDKFLHKWVGRKEKIEVDTLLRRARDLRWRSNAQASDIPTPSKSTNAEEGEEKDYESRNIEMEQAQNKEEETKEQSCDEAIKLLVQALFKGTNNQQADVLLELADLYEEINYWEEAIRSYSSCLELQCWRLFGFRRKHYNKLMEKKENSFSETDSYITGNREYYEIGRNNASN